MIADVILFTFFAILNVIHGNITGKGWMAICGILIIGIATIITCLWDIKKAIDKKGDAGGR